MTSSLLLDPIAMDMVAVRWRVGTHVRLPLPGVAAVRAARGGEVAER